jgi:hypothetical protein
VQPINPDILKEQVVVLEVPLYVPPGHYLGVYQRGYPPRVQYKKIWSKKEPVKYNVYCALKQGGHPTEVGDVVHRMLHSEECAGMTFVVKHFENKDDVKTFLKKFEKEREEKKKNEQQEKKEGNEGDDSSNKLPLQPALRLWDRTEHRIPPPRIEHINRGPTDSNDASPTTTATTDDYDDLPVCESTSGDDMYMSDDGPNHWDRPRENQHDSYTPDEERVPSEEDDGFY